MNGPSFSGRFGIGGSQVPFAEDPQRRFFQMLATPPRPQGQPLQGGPMPQPVPMGPVQRPQLASGQMVNPQVAAQAQMLRPDAGGVRPGVAPGMNAVEAARAQQAGGQPSGGAALRGYMNAGKA
jgi:hypothetical protein